MAHSAKPVGRAVRKPGGRRNSALARVLPDAAVEPARRAMTGRAGRTVAWMVVVASPLATVGGLVVLRPGAAPNPVPAAEKVQRGPQGWAEMYVRSWLSASRDDSAALVAFYPDGMRSEREVGSQIPVATATVSTVSPEPGVWSVVVAANLLTLQPDGTRPAKITCEQVGFVGDGSSYAATSLPTPVTCPATAAQPELAYGQPADPAGPVGQSVVGFLTAYLVGQGQLDRYVSPGTSVAPVSPTPFVSVRLQDLRTHETFEPGQAARPLDGTQVRVLARAKCFDATGQSTLADYPLTLTARSGRWELTRIDPVPLREPTPGRR
ncbi:conjugal transfer protein [Amycolatopsis echigonensis]|uniref:Conjugal transfer protein n=2 Tax=Amycolatopsis TaxID=1813 RepID=A0A8E1VUD6_9PSEU|nr:conjugal transfer protein [Amycolatopsis echigonensis]